MKVEVEARVGAGTRAVVLTFAPDFGESANEYEG